jgi:hypothetical protein
MLFDFTFERSSLMIPNQFAQGRFVKRLQHIGELSVSLNPWQIPARG